MYAARNHTDFNAALNRIAGTNRVAYSKAWDMSIPTGRAYMNRAYDQVGRIYANARLQSESLQNSKLCNGTGSRALTALQKVSLSAMHNSQTSGEFDAAVRTASKYGALNRMAATLFTRPAGPRAIRANPARHLRSAMRARAAALSAVPMEVSVAAVPMEVSVAAVPTEVSAAAAAAAATPATVVAAVPMEISKARTVVFAERPGASGTSVAPRVKRRKNNAANK